MTDNDLMNWLEKNTVQKAKQDKAYHAVLFVFKGKVWFAGYGEGLMGLKGHKTVRLAITAHLRRAKKGRGK